jgi:hypothetical protein
MDVGPSETSAFAAFEEPLWAKCRPVVARESRLEKRPLPCRDRGRVLRFVGYKEVFRYLAL